MPFFGSKKEKQQNPPQGGGYQYPKQSPYPTQPSGPAGAVAHGEQPPPYTPQGQPQYAGAPPPPQYAQQPPPHGQPPYYPPQPQYGAQYGGFAPPSMGYMPGGGAYPMHPQIPPGSQVVGHGSFDAGARFNSGASVNIPPPPPGAMPTAAQYAAAYGGTVTMGQNRSGFFTGGSDGGVSTHID